MCKPMNTPRRTKDEDESNSPSITSSVQSGVEKVHVGDINGRSPKIRNRQHPSPAYHAQEDDMRISTEPAANKQTSSSSKNVKREREFDTKEEKEAYTRRLLSNRRAAQASRERKKFLIEDLNKTVSTLTEEKRQLEELNSELRRQLQESRQEQERLSNMLRRSTSLTHTQSSPSLGALSSASLSSLLGPSATQTTQIPAHNLGSSAGLTTVNNGSVPYLPSIASQILSLPPIVHSATATLNANNLLLQQHLQHLQGARPPTVSVVFTNNQQPPASGAIHQAQQALQMYQSKHLSGSTSAPLPNNNDKKETSTCCKLKKKSAPSA